MKCVACLIVMLSLVASPLAAAQKASLAERIAEAYGIDGWSEIQQLDFAFNVQLPDGKTVKRSWSWDVGSGGVTRTVDGESVSFEPGGVDGSSGEEVRKAHQQFINDTYWLLFPFQLVWSDAAVTGVGEEAVPMGEGKATKVVAQWPSEGGYTPGDAYDLYLGDDGMIEQWVFRRGGQDAAKGSPATWEEHRQLGPIVVSLDHYGPEAGNGKQRFHLWFTDVEATLKGGETVTPGTME